MTHIRAQIRAAAVVMAKTIPGVTVGTSQVSRFKTLPAVNVFTSDEVASERGTNSVGKATEYDRHLQLNFEILQSAEGGTQDYSDGIASLIETAIAAGETFGGLAVTTRYLGTSDSAEALEADPLLQAIVSFDVWYRTTGLDPETSF